MRKRILRSEALARRKRLTPEQARDWSLAVQERFLALPEFARARTLALYAPIHNEVETGVIAEAALSSGKTLFYPAVVAGEMHFCAVTSASELRPGTFGILEPAGTPCDAAEADLIVVPGVVFDLCGRRIGYGKGFYDRSLHRLEGSGRLVACCYEFQLVQEIVGEPHDVTMDVIVTESQVVRVQKI